MVDCCRKVSRCGFGMVLSSVADLLDAYRNICWEEAGSFLNFSFFSSLANFFSCDSVSKREVRFWMLPARFPKVASDGPTTDDAAGVIGTESRMCRSDKSFRFCWTTPSC